MKEYCCKLGVYTYIFQQDRQCKYKRNNEVRSQNHCCRGKAISITYSECVCSLSYPACKAHAPFYMYTAVCRLSGSTTFFKRYFINGTTFGKELLNIKCVFLSSLQLLSEIFLILRIIRRHIINVHRPSCKVPVILDRF